MLLLSLPIFSFPISYYVPRTFRKVLSGRGVAGRDLEIRVVILERLFGAAALGLPALLLAAVWLPAHPGHFGVNLNHLSISLLASVVGWLVVWAVLTCTARTWPAGFTGYPQMRVSCWDPPLVARNTASWCVYIVAHEFLFRGVLLFALADIYGAWPAILITTGLHSFKHLPREPQEQLITIWVGIWFGGLALVTGSLVAPILTHAFTAAMMDYAAIRTVPGASLRPQCPEGAA